MTWEEVCEHTLFRDLPFFKVETDRWGRVVMSPAKNNHGFLQGDIVRLLGEQMPHGRVSTELGVQTSDGVKVADVAWASAALYRRLRSLAACDIAPEICVEIISASNSPAEMAEKRDLYLASGAREVWLVDGDTRRVEFYGSVGRLERSELCPDFPAVAPEA